MEPWGTPEVTDFHQSHPTLLWGESNPIRWWHPFIQTDKLSWGYQPPAGRRRLHPRMDTWAWVNPKPCKNQTATVTQSRKPVPTNLNIGGHNISPSPSVKYLGVTLSSKLTWSEHVTTICKAAKRQIGLIHRQLHQALVDVRRKIVHTAILPKLEYCSAVWDPHHKQDIAKLDSVQKFAGRMVLRNWTADIADLQSTLGWSPLKVRRRNIKLKVLYNILNNYSCIPQTASTYHPHPSPRHPHNKILFQPFVSTLSHRHSFFVDVIPVWNTLSPLVVNSPSPNTFKTRLYSFL